MSSAPIPTEPETFMTTTPSSDRPTLVWDLPVRVFHWLLVLCVAGAWVSAESERWAGVHVTLGLTAAALVAFRLLWGVFGTRTARFTQFVRGPGAAWRYARSLFGPKPEHHTGHNPAGALVILGLLALVAVTTATGLAGWIELGGLDHGDVHEVAATLLLALAGVHVAGVLVGSWRHRENLVRAMINGRKAAAPGQGLRRSAWPVGLALALAVVGFWGWEFAHPPGTPGSVVAAFGGAGVDGQSAAALRHDKDGD